MFGNRKEQNEQLQADVDRLAGMPLAELAAEVMTKGFGPGGPAGDGHYAELSTIAGALTTAEGSFLDDGLRVAHFRLVAEAAQLLEHAGLVRYEISSSGGIVHWPWTTTRAGAEALAQNNLEDLLRERVAQQADKAGSGVS